MNFLTELREGLLIAWSTIRANKLRSVLTTLGIIIGVVTVTLMGTAIQGMNNQFMSNISSIGAERAFCSGLPGKELPAGEIISQAQKRG